MSIRWGIIGTGDVADRKGGPALYQADRSSLVAVTSRTLARAEAFSKRHGNPRVHDSVDSLLSDDDVNAVYVATYPDSHADLTERAAKAGKHVLCEKPMAMSVEEAGRMVSVCEDHGVSLTIAFYRREFPVVQKMKEYLRDGAIGKPLSIMAETYSQFTSPDEEPWRLDVSQSGGGFLMDMGSHRFDLFAHFFGRPTVITGTTERQTLSQSVEDAASVSLKFDGGILGTASFHWNTCINRDSLRIVGTEGMLSVDDLSGQGNLTLETKQGKQSSSWPSAAPVHLGLVNRLVEHLLDARPNPCPGYEGLIATEIIEGVTKKAGAI